jgi:hypothetical protein
MAKGWQKAKKDSRKRGAAEDKRIRRDASKVGGIPYSKRADKVYTNAMIDKRITQMRAGAELCTQAIPSLEIPEDEKVWKQMNNLMPQGKGGNMAAFPLLTTESIVHKAVNRLMPPHEEANYNITMAAYYAKKPKGNPKPLNSKAQKAAREERQKRYGTGSGTSH